MLEICNHRLGSLSIDPEADEELEHLSFFEVVKIAWHDRSVKSLGMGLLTWMQVKAAKLLGNKLGGELSVAAKEAYLQQAHIVLGDRLYDVTIQRISDRLKFQEKIKAFFLLIWEVITMSFGKIKEYVQKSQDDESFVQDEIEKFAKYFPSLSNVIINERDEYLAQSLLETAKVLSKEMVTPPSITIPSSSSIEEEEIMMIQRQQLMQLKKKKIVAVVGAGHLPGIQFHLQANGVSLERLTEISTSSKHASTWPGSCALHVLDGSVLYGNKPK
jgi:pheromone shutdown protein TraB